jgi:hypothetical protein
MFVWLAVIAVATDPGGGDSDRVRPLPDAGPKVDGIAAVAEAIDDVPGIAK